MAYSKLAKRLSNESFTRLSQVQVQVMTATKTIVRAQVHQFLLLPVRDHHRNISNKRVGF